MLESIVEVVVRHWPSALIFLVVAYLAKNYYNHGLQKYPGPLLASFTDWWRFFDVLGRRPDITQNRLHKQHGDIVRLGPNALSFADPQALKTIYGLNKGFTKVRFLEIIYITAMLTKAVRILPRTTSHVERRAAALALLNHRREVPCRASQMREWCFLNDRACSV